MATGHIGQVGGHIAVASANFTRPANTTQYASGDLVANSTTAGSVTPMQFTVTRSTPQGQSLGLSWMIRRVVLRKNDNDTTSASFRLHLWDASPTPANGDNAAFSTDGFADYIGGVDITCDQGFSDGDVGFSPQIEIGRVMAAESTVIYGLLEARDTYTPASGEVFTVELEVIQD